MTFRISLWIRQNVGRLNVPKLRWRCEHLLLQGRASLPHYHRSIHLSRGGNRRGVERGCDWTPSGADSRRYDCDWDFCDGVFTRAIAIGRIAEAVDEDAIAIGHLAASAATSSIAIGPSAYTDSCSPVVVNVSPP